ncbi:hypothetical protein ASD78_00095 [Lysobacter sp. Root667]|uniref:hypothetical protein n=1 Tax=Lysobacter sp. Root667 TaxID=1736581 RepID=UPI0006F78F36|nr:hypothetical protein [Lysobacter sp. Root667]KRA81720.1 hypothetical protein ASD78_00095 [Lysobacter sp. Root667]
MEISTIANILGIFGGVVLIGSGLWRFARYLRQRIAEIRRASEQGRALARELASRATNPERRADIHAYLALRAIEFEGEHTREAVYMSAIGVVVIGLTMVSLQTVRSSGLPWSDPWVIALMATLAGLYAMVGVLLFYGRVLRQLRGGWQQGAMDAMNAKIGKHLAD